METFTHSLPLMTFALTALLLVLPSANFAAAAVVQTILRPIDPSVPEGGQIRLNCSGDNTPDCDYGAFLYREKDESFTAEVGPVQVVVPSTCSGCSGGGGGCTVSVMFVMDATLEAAGTYGCVMQRRDQPRPADVRNHRGHETTVTVCQVPDIEVHTRSVGNTLVAEATDSCYFPAVLSWLINGRPVARESASSAPSGERSPPAAVHRNNDRLEIPGCDRWAARTPCNVTAEFRYISASRMKVARMLTAVADCCVDLSSTVDESVRGNNFPQSSPSPRNKGGVHQTPPRVLAPTSAVVLGISTVALGGAAFVYRRRWKRQTRSCTDTADASAPNAASAPV